MSNERNEQREKIANAPGFIAALDQSGGSTPKALRLYGIGSDQYSSDDEMFNLVHEMRERIITCSAFGGDRILAAILFEMTMDRTVLGRPTADFLWNVKNVVPFLKIDKGLETENAGVQLMKPIPDLEALLARAVQNQIFGTKMRSVIKDADRDGIKAVIDQQFEVAKVVRAAGLMPIIEPEIDINSTSKGAAEEVLLSNVLGHLRQLPESQQVMIKLTLPEIDGFYSELVEHPRILKVVALSGGYPQTEADERLARQPGIVGSFSRALTQGLSVDQTDREFTDTLDESIANIYAASLT